MSTPPHWDASQLHECPKLNLIAGEQWRRIARLFGGDTALERYASKESRFDLPGLYLADRIAGALTEKRLVFVDQTTGRYISKIELNWQRITFIAVISSKTLLLPTSPLRSTKK